MLMSIDLSTFYLYICVTKQTKNGKVEHFRRDGRARPQEYAYSARPKEAFG